MKQTKILFYLSTFLLFWFVLISVITEFWSGWLLCVSCLILSLLFGLRWYKEKQFGNALTKLKDSQGNINDSLKVDTKKVSNSSKK